MMHMTPMCDVLNDLQIIYSKFFEFRYELYQSRREFDFATTKGYPLFDYYPIPYITSPHTDIYTTVQYVPSHTMSKVPPRLASVWEDGVVPSDFLNEPLMVD